MDAKDIAFLSSAARTADGVSDEVEGNIDATRIIVISSVSASSGTTPTLDIYLQTYVAGEWIDILHLTQQTGNTKETGIWTSKTVNTVAAAVQDGALVAGTARHGINGSKLRIKYKIGGTTPSFTFTVNALVRSR